MICALMVVRELVVWKSVGRDPGRQSSLCKHPKLGVSLLCSRNRKEAMWLEWKQKRGEGTSRTLEILGWDAKDWPFHFASACYAAIRYFKRLKKVGWSIL